MAQPKLLACFKIFIAEIATLATGLKENFSLVLGVPQICNYAPTLVPGNEVSENSTDNPITRQEILISETRPKG